MFVTKKKYEEALKTIDCLRDGLRKETKDNIALREKIIELAEFAGLEIVDTKM